jgi:mevalonate kinase
MESFPAKILLFGEYSILQDSFALAIPFNKFSGEWAFPEQDNGRQPKYAYGSNRSLLNFLDYLKKPGAARGVTHFPDIDLFESDLQKGLYFKSDIPEGSGFGSSGAVTAAVLKRYASPLTGMAGISELRNDLALLESFFHGKSSGIDPLVSYYASSILISDKGNIEFPDISADEIIKKYGLFIVQDDNAGSTKSFVKKFRDRCLNDKSYMKEIRDKYIPLNNLCINAIIDRTGFQDLFKLLRNLTLLQLRLFPGMISEKMISIAEYGISQGLCAIKLCGSGGGGYMLGFTDNTRRMKEYFYGNQCRIVFVNN